MFATAFNYPDTALTEYLSWFNFYIVFTNLLNSNRTDRIHKFIIELDQLSKH